MNRRHIIRWGSATLIVLSALMALTGCSTGVEPRNISTPERVREVRCDIVEEIHDIVTAAAEPAAAPGRRAELRRWGIDPTDQSAIDSVVLALEGRIAECEELGDSSPQPQASATAPETSASAEPSPAPTVTVTETVTVTVTPSSEEIRSWGELMATHPEVEQLVNANEAELGWSWSDVQEWTEFQVNGKTVDARIVVVVGGPLDDADARQQAGVSDEAVHVVQASACVAVDGDDNKCPSGAFVVFTPLVESGGKVKLDPGTGVVLTEEAALVVYQR